MPLGRRPQRSEQVQILLEVSFLETRVGVAAVARDQVVALGEDAAEESTAKRGIGHEPDLELIERRQDLGLDVAGPERILGLQRAQRMHRVGAADRLGTGLAEAEVAHLALLDETRHGADRVLDRNVGIDAMDVIEVDRVDAEPLEACLAGDRHVLGLAVDAAALPAWPANVAELAGYQEFVALALDGLSDQLLVDAGRVGI